MVLYMWNYWWVKYLTIYSKMLFLYFKLVVAWKETHAWSINGSMDNVLFIWQSLGDLPPKISHIQYCGKGNQWIYCTPQTYKNWILSHTWFCWLRSLLFEWWCIDNWYAPRIQLCYPHSNLSMFIMIKWWEIPRGIKIHTHKPLQ